MVVADPAALERLIGNLVDNAVRHASSAVTVAVGGSDHRVSVTVTDDGPGIAEPDRQRVFERFTRLDYARDRDHGGSGLGLAIVRELAHAHGGTVRIEDAAPGARFVVELPRAPALDLGLVPSS